MVDRVDLIRATAVHVELPATKGAQYQKALEKALTVVLGELPLKSARSLRLQERDELALALDQVLTFADLKRVSKNWEPSRPVSSGFTQTELVEALQDLLYGRREPYEPPELPLDAVYGLGKKDRKALEHAIVHLMPVSHLKKLIKRWDRHFKPPQGWVRANYVQHLGDLANGKIEPTPKPPPKPRRKKKI